MNLPEYETGRAIGNLSKEPCLATELFRLTIINHYKRNLFIFQKVIRFPYCVQGEESSTDGRTLQRGRNTESGLDTDKAC